MIPRQPRNVRAVAVSIILHVVIGSVILQALSVPSVLIELFSTRGQPVVVEQIGFIALPRGGGAGATPKAGGDNRPPVENPAPEAAPLLITPTQEPTTLPETPTGAAKKATGGYGEIIDGGGATRGIRPSYNDPRVWLPSSPVVTAPMRLPRTRADSLHDLLADKIRLLNDSIEKAEGSQRAPGDWTFKDSKGRKYGIDQQYIRLGKFSIPTAVLALLPLNAQANPIAMDRQRAMSLMTREIQEQSARATRDDEFRAAVKELRARKDRERREAQEKGTTKPDAPPPVAPVKPETL